MKRTRYLLTEAGRTEAATPATEAELWRWHAEYRVHAHSDADETRTTYGQIISHRHEYPGGAIVAEFPRLWAQQLRDAAARLECAGMEKPGRERAKR